MTKAETDAPVSIRIRTGRKVAKKHSHQIFIITLALVVAGLAAQSTAIADPNIAVFASHGILGIYQLSFFTNNPTPPPDFIPLTNNSLPVGDELILQ